MKNTLIINDLSAFGNCSLTVNLAVLQNLKLQTHAVPSFILSHQSDFDDFYIKDNFDGLTGVLNKFNNTTFDGILCGYLKTEENINCASNFIENFNGLKLIDPVFGDHGKLYKGFTLNEVELYKKMVKNADIITPNLTEACYLSNQNYQDFCNFLNINDLKTGIKPLLQSLRKLTNAVIFITGIKVNNKLCNLLFEKEIYTFFVKDNGKHFSGSGDLFASIIFGKILNGSSYKKALKIATKFIKKAVDYSVSKNQTGNFGLLYQKFLKKL
ncbi:MAG: hypothetical protein E7342_03705 [Clostridiales bacterium]|nr:hypothetical protein [Clostridiales bacterium]